MQITVQGLSVEVPERYKPGPVTLSDGEASAFQQTFAENIRNNTAKQIKAMIEEAEKAGKPVNLAAVQKLVTEYANTYEFYVTRQADPVETLARKLAGDVLRKSLREKGVKVKDLPEGEFDRRVEKALENNPQITEFARKQVEAGKKLKSAISI